MSRISQHEALIPEVRRSSHRATVALGVAVEGEEAARTRRGARFPVVVEGIVGAGVLVEGVGVVREMGLLA